MAEEYFIEGEDYPAVSGDADELFEDEATLAAKKAFGIKYLFPWQKLVIANILDSANALQEQNCQDDADFQEEVCRGRQIVLLPTGAGKSLCFLTPALLLDGPTMVLYPLLALMTDQQRRMEQGNLRCVVFKGGQTEEERADCFKKLADGAKVILANPEVLQNKQLVQRLSKFNIRHIAIDEAHCVSEWGDSFRPAYLTLGKIIKELNCQVVTAFTATASPPILSRISEVLFDSQAHIIQSSADRANIHYEVRYTYAKRKAVLKACKEAKKPLIVFCGTRLRAEKMSRVLNAYFGKGLSKFYHAGMTSQEKKSVQDWFFDSKEGMLCSTCAFGMGIDKSDIQTVIHLDVPEHLENFIQEAGRGGRNGDNVKSILLWNHLDTIRHRQQRPHSREKVMGDFALTRGCRRRFLMDYLNDQASDTNCSGCDYCDSQRSKTNISYQAADAEYVLDFIKKHRRLYTFQEAVTEIRNRFNKKDLQEFKMNIWEEKDVSEIFSQLISERKLIRMGGLWKNHLDIAKTPLVTSRLLKCLSPLYRHRLHRLRKNFRQLEQVLEQLFS